MIKKYYAVYSDAVGKIKHRKYEYTNIDGFMYIFTEGFFNGDIRKAQQIYWKEILLRAHFAAVTSLIRNEKWLTGVIMGISTRNLMVFSSSLRGFLESTADSFFSLESLPTSLALNFKNINLAIKGELNQFFVNDDIESRLIHYQFAKRGKKGVDEKSSIAHTNAEYINDFDINKIGIRDLYAELCEVTHPAANSVKCFTQEKIISERYSYLVTSTEADYDVISEIITEYSNQIEYLLKGGISLYCICLKILTLFDFEDIHSEYINESIFESILNKNAWNEVLEMIDKGQKYLDEHEC
ncbi:hypothetical protein lbkm_0607 [Lachnospiraceae bacterium KM106-2]|nr:hypothetical protein lbkm_0607 [Lachnospiraceae bacterium KM106-2]